MDLTLKRYWGLMAQYLLPLWKQVLLLALLIFSSTVLQLVQPQILGQFIDTVTGEQTGHSLLGYALAFLGFGLLLQGIAVASTYLGETIGWQATNQLRADLARHCLRLDMTFHNVHTPGEMTERIDGDISNIAAFFSQLMLYLINNFLFLIGVFIILIREDWRISLAFAIYTVFALVSLNRVRNVSIPQWEATRAAAANLFGFLEEHLSGTEDIRSNGAEAYVMQNLFKLNEVRLNTDIHAQSVNSIIRVVIVCLEILGLIMAVVLCYFFYQDGRMTIGAVYLVIYYAHLIFGPLRSLSEVIEGLQESIAGINRVDELYAIKSRLKKVESPETLSNGPLSVEFDQVSFAYVADKPTLRQISFNLQPGQLLGLLGRTGSGKTTITRLLFRLYDPDTGTIRLGVNGESNRETLYDLQTIKLDDVRRSIGMVTQEVQLFSGTIRDNVAFFDKDIADERILNAIEAMNLSDWYMTLPEGLDTELGAHGGNLSAGEAQLLAMVRVFLKDPGLVILDEASSRLDLETERRLERALDKLLEHRTGIIIAHRLNTVQRVNAIAIIEEGQIKEYGHRVELANDPTSRFYQLLQTGLEEVLE